MFEYNGMSFKENRRFSEEEVEMLVEGKTPKNGRVIIEAEKFSHRDFYDASGDSEMVVFELLENGQSVICFPSWDGLYELKW